MKKLFKAFARWKYILVLTALVCGTHFTASAEDFKAELAELKAKMEKQDSLLARQDDELKKLRTEAEMSSSKSPQNLTSIKKNAMVSIGGRLRTRYYERYATIDTVNAADVGRSEASMRRAGAANIANFTQKDAKVNIAVKVDDHFSAYFRIDLQSSGRVQGNAVGPWGQSDNAEQAYVQWKNVCNSGFGVLIGRDILKFGQGDNPGALGTYVANNGEGIGDIGAGGVFNQFLSYDDTSNNGFSRSPIAPHNTWDISRVMQITPFWENADGKVRLEASIMQYNNDNRVIAYPYANGEVYYKSNDWGASYATRAIVKPIEGMMLTGGFLALHNSTNTSDSINRHRRLQHSTYNYASDLAFSYRPSAFDSFKVWAEWIHGWNVNNVKNLDSDAVNLGVSYDFGKAWTVFAQADYLKVRQHTQPWDWNSVAYAAYGGIQYKFPFGAMLEVGWKHEWVNDKVNGFKASKARGDTVYGHLGFDF